jgi:hypothetical protein
MPQASQCAARWLFLQPDALAASLMSIFAVGPLVDLATGSMTRPKAVSGTVNLGISSINYREFKKPILEPESVQFRGRISKRGTGTSRRR